ncbi:YciI family protein [uncultured Nocardioides sp.]|uniref:YciI family protein n=1 Tax=uncultured Nocardioides sp. TaxID=198441 RepID=UPI002631A0D7|nr:YciI family protein [uncultured Nocardioides sp.]
MKFLLLFWTEPVPEGGQYAEGLGTEADYRAWTEFEARLKADGTYVDSGDLEPPAGDRHVRPDLAADRDVPAPTADGPVVSGYYVVEVADADAARAVAASVPLYGTVEVRPVVDYSAWS